MQTSFGQSIALWFIAISMIVGIPALLWLVPPPFFTSAKIDVDHGMSISEAAEKLTDAGVIYTPELITIPFRLSDERIVAGTYQFDKATSAATVADRLVGGLFGVSQQQIVIPEGFTNKQIADRLTTQFDREDFSRKIFLAVADQHEGYLYPDTYQFHSDVTESEVVDRLQSNFFNQLTNVQPQIDNFGKPLEEVIKMASLIEREAADYEVRRRIAGVLWNRFERGMPLQVDAVFAPLIGKSTYELTATDLQMDSPYNLYTERGLPPTPIANPGLEAIQATVNPIETDNLYYLSDVGGNFYFSETLTEHNKNKRAFLTKNVN